MQNNNNFASQINEKVRQQTSTLTLKKNELKRKQDALKELERKETNEKAVITALQAEIHRLENEITQEHQQLNQVLDASKKEITKHGITLH